MKKKTSPKRHLLLTKNFIMMLVMLVVIIVAISAWFTQYKTVDATNISVKAESSEIDIAQSIKTYNADGTVKTDGPGVFGSEVVFQVPVDFGKFTKDCTGDGVNLIVPEFNVTNDYESVRKNGGKEVNENLSASDALSNVDSARQHSLHPENDPPEYQYLEFDFYVRSKNKELKLMPETRVVASTEAGGSSLSTVPEGKKSEYGNFNVDGLVGAIRVSLIGQGCTSVNQAWENGSLVTDGERAPSSALNAAERQLLWLPRPDVHLDINPNEGDVSNWGFSTGVTSQQFNGETYKAAYYTGTSSGVVLNPEDEDAVVSSGTATESGVQVKSLGQSVNITDFTYSNQLSPISLVVNGSDISVTDNYYVTKYKMKVWIEGTDTEARRAMDGGKFNIKLYFA